MARVSNLRRAEWNKKSREILSTHIHSRLGILIEPSQVRLKTTPDDPYIWERLKEKEHLFKKNISDHSIAALKELCEGVGQSFVASGKISTKELPVGCFQEYLGYPEVSFTAKIQELQEELSQWKHQAGSELEMRRSAEKRVNQLNVVIQQVQGDNEKLEQYVQEWKLIAEQSQVKIIGYDEGIRKIFAISEGLESGVF